MTVKSSDTTAAIVDGIIKFVAGGGFITTALIAPPVVLAFNKPLTKLLNSLDERQRQRELRRVLHYMKSRGLIRYNPRDYEHGIQLTESGRKRLEKVNFNGISLRLPDKWDGKWRLIIFDIPAKYKNQRYMFNKKLRDMGFQRLQFSAWVHPFPSRAEIELACKYLGIRKYVSYLEVTGIDSEQRLKDRFKHLIKS